MTRPWTLPRERAPGSRRENLLNFALHRGGGDLLRERQLLHEQAARLVQKAALAERQIFVELQAVHIAENLGDLGREAALQHLRVGAEPTIPGLDVHRDLWGLENVQDLLG